jgi:hypothetical protein
MNEELSTDHTYDEMLSLSSFQARDIFTLLGLRFRGSVYAAVLPLVLTMVNFCLNLFMLWLFRKKLLDVSKCMAHGYRNTKNCS